MKPQFPDFKQLSIDDRPALTEFTRRFPDYTEFNFTYLFAWDLLDPICYCYLNDNLVIRFTDVQTNKKLLTLLGDNQAEETIDTILDYCKDKNMGEVLQNIPEVIVKSLHGKSKYTVVEDSKYHDYILSVHELAGLEGSKFVKKRNLVHRFEEQHGHLTTTREIDLSDPTVQIQLKRVMQEWRRTFDGSADDIDLEFRAIDKALAHSKELKLRGFGSYVSGQLESFTIFEIVSSKTMVLHFDKATRTYKGLGENHKHKLSQHVAAEQIELINYQDDLGIAELKLAKSTYRPIGYLKKYTVRHSASHASVHKNINLVTI